MIHNKEFTKGMALGLEIPLLRSYPEKVIELDSAIQVAPITQPQKTCMERRLTSVAYMSKGNRFVSKEGGVVSPRGSPTKAAELYTWKR